MRRQQPERAEQEAVKKLLSAMGAKFWVAGTVRRKGDHPGTMQTPGLPDIPLCFLPVHYIYVEDGKVIDPVPEKELKRRDMSLPVYELVVIEVKSPAQSKTKSGGLRPEQVEVKRLCEQADIAYIHGDLDAIIGWLIEHGYLKAENVPHYRVKP